MIDEISKVRRSGDVAAQGLSGNEGGVLLHLKSGQYHGVDRVGWVIWNLLDGSRGLAELAAELEERFPDGRERLLGDVRTFVKDLLARNLAEIVPSVL